MEDRWYEDSIERRRITESYGVIALVLVFATMMVILYRFQAAVADRTACGQNVRLLMQAMSLYSQDYDGRYPPQQGWAKNLLPYVDSLSIYSCPADEWAYRSHKKRKTTDIPVSYWYLETSTEGSDESALPLIGDRMLPTMCGNHDDGGNVGYLDGHVSWWSSDQWEHKRLPTAQYDQHEK